MSQAEQEMEAVASSVDERTYRGPDRRTRTTPRISRYSFLGGRRRGARREDELEGSFVDLYNPFLMLVIGWVALMNVGDSFFTLFHLQAGGIELNPVAERLLECGRFHFVFWKSLLISIALLVLCVHKNFFLARLGLWASVLCYTLLFGYHIYLLGV